MVVTFAGKLNQDQKDALIVYFFGHYFQKSNPSEYRTGITARRIDTAVALLLRHLEFLVNKNHIPAFITGLSHGPHRGGQTAFRLLLPGTFNPNKPSNTALHVSEIIRTDLILRSLGVKAIRRSPELAESFFFPAAEKGFLEDLIKNIEFDAALRSVVCDLSGSYSIFTKNELEILSSCPTEKETFRAICADIHLWHYDISQILRVLGSDRLNEERLTILQDRITSSFHCLQDALLKPEWYADVPTVKKKIAVVQKSKKQLGTLIHLLGDGQKTRRIEAPTRIINCMADFAGTIVRNLMFLGLKFEFSPVVWHFMERSFGSIGELDNLNSTINKIHRLSARRHLVVLHELSYYFEVVTQKIGKELQSQGYPGRFDKGWLFGKYKQAKGS